MTAARQPAARRGSAGTRGTLLSKMGFADKDRQDPMHDAACGYIAANALAVYRKLVNARAATASVVQEYLVSKGSGQYKTTVGFVDVVVTAESWQKRVAWPTSQYAQWPEHLDQTDGRVWVASEVQRDGAILGVEVKWSESSMSDALRQIGVYQSICSEPIKGDYDRLPGCGAHVPDWRWALAAPWLLNAEQRAALTSQKVLYVQLDRDHVARWADKNRSTPAEAEMVL